MIKDKKQLLEYLQEDAALYLKVSSGYWSRLKHCLVTSPQSYQWKIYSYIRTLRFAEYHKNNSFLSKSKSVKSAYHTICMLYQYWKLKRLSWATGFQIDPNSFGKGLMIYHYGSIVVNENARIGDYATIYPGVVIGAKASGCPHIGHHCFIGAGSKILGGENRQQCYHCS